MNINWTLGRRLAAVFGALLAIQIIVAVIAYSGITQLAQNSALASHTSAIIYGLNAVRTDLLDVETGERGFVITGDANYLQPYQSGLQALDADMKSLRLLSADQPSLLARLDTLAPLIASKLAVVKQTIDLRQANGQPAAQANLALGSDKSIMDNIRTIIADAQQTEQNLVAQRTDSAAAAGQAVLWANIAGVLVAALVVLVAGVLLSRSVSALRLYTANLSEASTQLGVSATEILQAVTQAAAGTAEMAASINETTTTVETMRQATQLSSQKALYVTDTAQRALQVSQNGQKAVEETAIVMDRIREQMETIAQTVVRLSEQSQSIGGIIASVTDLADQSNLLAVNAAIEAAKAGEQGKGFAVVAQEIKSLAEQSKQATAQVRGILSDVQKATSSAVMATEQGSKAVEAGVKQATQAGAANRALTETSEVAVQAAVQIAASNQQQVVGMEQIGVAMENINQAGSQNAGGLKQMAISAKNLHELGQNLKGLVLQFKV